MRAASSVCVDAFEFIRDIFCATDIFRDAIAACPNMSETRATWGYMCYATLNTKSVRHRARTHTHEICMIIIKSLPPTLTTRPTTKTPTINWETLIFDTISSVYEAHSTPARTSEFRYFVQQFLIPFKFPNYLVCIWFRSSASVHGEAIGSVSLNALMFVRH